MNHRLIDLAQRARAGARPELETLLTACVGVVHAIARGRLGDTEAAEAATADALGDIARGITGLDDPTAFPRWVHSITRRRAAKRSVVARYGPRATSDLVDPGRGPVELLVATEREARLRAAVAALPEDMRQPVLLHFVEGMSYREIAATLDTGLGTVVRRMRGALLRLERELGEQP